MTLPSSLCTAFPERSALVDVEPPLPRQFAVKDIIGRRLHPADTEANQVWEIERLLANRLVLVFVDEPPLFLPISVHGELHFVPTLEYGSSARVALISIGDVDRLRG